MNFSKIIEVKELYVKAYDLKKNKKIFSPVKDLLLHVLFKIKLNMIFFLPRVNDICFLGCLRSRQRKKLK